MGRRTLLSLIVGTFAILTVPAAMAPSLAQTPTTATAEPATDSNAAYDTLLQRYVTANPDGVTRVDYAKWKANTADLTTLNQYIKTLEAMTPSKMARAEAFAYWGNLYNAITLKVILDRYPVASIRDIKSDSWLDFKAYTGPWRQQRVTVEGKPLSLDAIEHEVMRPTFKDPRVHYVVNCASFGCPNLMNRAWRAATLEADLNAAARAFINHPRGVSALPTGGLKVSSIYKWFIVDFGGDDAGLLAHFKAFAEPALAQRLATSPKIIEDGYDWTLNSAQTNSASTPPRT